MTSEANFPNLPTIKNTWQDHITICCTWLWRQIYWCYCKVLHLTNFSFYPTLHNVLVNIIKNNLHGNIYKLLWLNLHYIHYLFFLLWDIFIHSNMRFFPGHWFYILLLGLLNVKISGKSIGIARRATPWVDPIVSKFNIFNLCHNR